MERHYDFVAIGGGSAGFNAARAATRHAARVAVVDAAPEAGGLCISRGCMPSKTLLHAADVLHHARHGRSLGLDVREALPDMPAIAARKRRIIGEFAGYRRKQLESGSFDLLRATARFTGPGRLALDDGTVVTADRFLVATGSTPSWPAVPGLRESSPWTSDDVLDLDFVPESVIVLGGGVVACELAQLLSRIGSRVTQIQRSPRLLREATPEAAAVVAQAFHNEGIEVLAGTRLLSVSFDGAEHRVAFQHEGRETVRRARHCLAALGREPATAALGLAEAGIEVLPSGHVRTDAFQRTTNPKAYAAGDCAGPHEIVHAAIQQAETAVAHAFGCPPPPFDPALLLRVVFTDPQIASVGPSAAELRAAGSPFLEASYPFDDHGKSILMEARYGYVKIFADARYGRVLGAEIVGRDAGELIHIMAPAVSAKLTVWDLLRAPWYHPTLAEILTYPLEDIADRLPRDGA
jgi:pyruvate/2-oxoglutarate dehydrogenase complex dihydrolipoamide dehydrogenase (E3) component